MGGTTRARPILALAFNATVWGLCWWPLRELHARGVHPLWSTVGLYALAVVGLTLWRPQAWRVLARRPALWWLCLASGTTNAAFNWAATEGDVVRVVLLFYVSPLWALLLARLVLREPLGPLAWGRVALALAGALAVLWPEKGGGFPLPTSLAEWLALLGGLSFALNNVMLRREADAPADVRALAMFGGGVVVAAAVGWALGPSGGVPHPPLPSVSWLVAGVGLALAFVAGNWALQYGASRLPASVTAVVTLCEVPIAAISAVLMGAGTFTPSLVLGALLIAAATLLAARH